MELQVSRSICNGIFNHTLLCEFHQGKLLLHLTIPFEEKPKTSMPSDNLRYYRRRNNLTTRQLAEQIGVVPATIVMYENGKHPIPYDVAIKLADVLKIEVSLLYDEFSRFLVAPYTEALKSVRTALGLSQKAFAEKILSRVTTINLKKEAVDCYERYISRCVLLSKRPIHKLHF